MTVPSTPSQRERRRAPLDVRRIVGNHAAGAIDGVLVQRSSTTPVADDPWEREADRVARDVTGALGRPRSSGGSPRSAGVPNRDATGTWRTGAPTGGSGGRPVARPLRALMERHLGTDLGSVRVHQGAEASTAARNLGARAFTSGTDVWLGAGESERDLGLMAHELTHVVQQRQPRLDRRGGGLGDTTAPAVQRLPFGITLPTGVRGLDPAEERIGRGVFGGSLDYGDIYLSDGLGGGGRPFTLYTPGLGTVIQMGSGPYHSPGSNPSLLIHEMTHSWQSQHHFNPAAYMANSIESQALASAAGGGASPYCYIPGKSFGSYGAEQIAQQVENGEPPIRAHVRSVAAGSWDAANIASLTVPRWETRGAPGVTC